MLRRLYEVIDGTPRLCDGVDYWKEMFDLQVDEKCYINPLAHLIKCDYSFMNDDNRISVMIRPSKGGIYLFITKDDEYVYEDTYMTFYEFYKGQILYYNSYGIPLVNHLMEVGVLTDTKMREYCSVLFFSPIVGDRPPDPYLLKIKEVVAQHKILGTLNHMMKPEYKYEDIDFYDYLVFQKIIEPIK